MPKRKFAAGTYDSYFRKKMAKRRRTRRVVPRRFPRGMTRIPTHSFHRWVTAMPSGNVGVTSCTYDTTTSVISCTPTNSTCEFTLNFPISAIPNVNEFTALFDAYRLTKIHLQIKMINSPDSQNYINSSTASNAANFYPTLWYTSDFDDSTTVSLAQIKEFERVKHRVLYPNRQINVILRPRCLTQVYRTSITTGYKINRSGTWLDLANTDIPHYGFKSVIDFEGVSPAANFQFKVNVKYYFQCKSAR